MGIFCPFKIKFKYRVSAHSSEKDDFWFVCRNSAAPVGIPPSGKPLQHTPAILPTWRMGNTEKKMSSGINWKYRVSNANPEEPPVRYEVGVSWASGGAKDEFVVGLFQGLEAIRTAYASLPGLGYNRNLWLSSELSGPEKIARDASRYLLAVAAHSKGKNSPLAYGGDPNRTVGKWIDDSCFVCGREIAEFAGVPFNSLFLANWETLAIAADEYPRQRWGVCPEVTRLKVERNTSSSSGREEVGKEEAVHVLATAEAWGRAVDLSWPHQEGIKLAPLLYDDAIRAAVAVTTKKGSISDLRHSLRVAGYLK